MVIMCQVHGPNAYLEYQRSNLPLEEMTRIQQAPMVLHDAASAFDDVRRPNIMLTRAGDKWRGLLVDFD